MPPWLYLTNLYCTTQKLIIKENVHIRPVQTCFSDKFRPTQEKRIRAL